MVQGSRPYQSSSPHIDRRSYPTVSLRAICSPRPLSSAVGTVSFCASRDHRKLSSARRAFHGLVRTSSTALGVPLIR
jgi:hypothetical protein